jgi:hypothetical protein
VRGSFLIHPHPSPLPPAGEGVATDFSCVIVWSHLNILFLNDNFITLFDTEHWHVVAMATGKIRKWGIYDASVCGGEIAGEDFFK